MKICTVVVGKLETNCYLLIDEESTEAIIIDPGDDADYIINTISDEEANPTQIIATHGHFDHILAVTELQLAFNIPFLIHKNDEFLVKRMNETARYFTGIEAGPPPKINAYLTHGQKIKIGSTSFEVIRTSGHTPGSVSLYCKKESLIISGDLIFVGGGLGRTDFSYSNSKDLLASLSKILRLPGDTIILSGHGPETTVAGERPLQT